MGNPFCLIEFQLNCDFLVPDLEMQIGEMNIGFTTVMTSNEVSQIDFAQCFPVSHMTETPKPVEINAATFAISEDIRSDL